MGKMTIAATPGYRVHLDLPPALYKRLASEAARRSATLDQVVQQVLERYAERETAGFDITQTRTWELCGALEVAEPAPEYVVGRDAQGKAITNYSEHVDDVLYRGG
jgi:hypothetical protein